MRFENQVAIVTGGSRGIGFAVAERLASEGAAIAVVSTTPESAGAAAEKLLAAGAPKAVGYPCNVASCEDVQNTVNAILAEFGKVDILVNNAGVTRDNLLMRMSEEEWDKVLDINLKGVFNFSKAVVRPMMRARAGRVINISSIVGIHGNPGQANYAASKAGIIGFSKAMAKEIASRNITVNVVAPGFIETDMSRAIPENLQQKMLENIPLGRMGTPADVANLVAFLASAEAAYLTGQVICVDGGMAV